jgi:hypothetical protein
VLAGAAVRVKTIQILTRRSSLLKAINKELKYTLSTELWIVLIATLNLARRFQNPYVQIMDFVTIVEISHVCTTISPLNEAYSKSSRK